MLKTILRLFCLVSRHDWMEAQWYEGEPTKWVCMRCCQVKYLREG